MHGTRRASPRGAGRGQRAEPRPVPPRSWAQGQWAVSGAPARPHPFLVRLGHLGQSGRLSQWPPVQTASAARTPLAACLAWGGLQRPSPWMGPAEKGSAAGLHWPRCCQGLAGAFPSRSQTPPWVSSPETGRCSADPPGFFPARRHQLWGGP